jgi:hypothetical protein
MKFCVYTGLFGNYEQLNEQIVQRNSNIDFICFTDDKDLTSESWKIMHTAPVFPLDPIRSARFVKIAAHRYLPTYETSLYIDNTVSLRLPPEEIFDNFLSNEFDLYCVKHSYRETVLDEFEEVIKLNLDKFATIIEQFNVYSMIDPEMFSTIPYWSGFLIRNHNKENIIDVMEDWLAQVLRYSRRDQLSLNYVIRRHNIKVKELELDNVLSKYHCWPLSIRHGSGKIKNSLINALENSFRVETLENQINKVIEENEILKNQLEECVKKNSKLSQKVMYYSQSNSWRYTRPLRKLMGIFRKDVNE